MKLFLFQVLGFALFLGTPRTWGQTTQSEIYDAFALLNAKKGLNALLIPQSAGYDIVDPLTGKIIEYGVTSTPSRYTTDLIMSDSILIEILKRNSGLPPSANKADVKEAYKDNPFLKDILSDKSKRIIELTDTISHVPKPRESGAIGANILGNLANGTADFLIKRAGEELSISVFEKLQKVVSQNPEFKILFPRTTTLIKPVTPYEYTNTLKALADAIQADLDQFTARIPELYNLPKYKLLNKEVPSITLIFASSTIITDAHGKEQLNSILHDLSGQSYLAEQNNYVTFIKAVSLLSDSFRKKLLSESETGNYDYISIKEINSMTQGRKEFMEEVSKYYLGLIFQKSRHLTIFSGATSTPLSKLISPVTTDVAKVMNAMIAITNKLKDLNSQLIEIREKETEASNFTDKATKKIERFAIYIEFIDETLQFIVPFIPDQGSNQEYIRQLMLIQVYWKPFTADLINIVQAFEQKAYTLAVHDFAHLLKTVSEFLKEEDGNSEAAKKLTSEFVNTLSTEINSVDSQIGEIQKQLDQLKKLTDTTTQDIKSQKEMLEASLTDLTEMKSEWTWQKENTKESLYKLSKVLDYVGLLVAISQTDNSQQVEQLLESYALPAGSSRVKKVTDFNLAVNAYVGGFYRSVATVGTGFTSQYGLTAPIGFTFSHGLSDAGSLSVFAGIFDIGGIIKYKLNNDGAYESDVSLAGIISPSVQLVYGFPFNLPLSFGFGAQWTTPSTSTSVIQLTPQTNVFLAVDIPLFNLAVVKKKWRRPKR